MISSRMISGSFFPGLQDREAFAAALRRNRDISFGGKEQGEQFKDILLIVHDHDLHGLRASRSYKYAAPEMMTRARPSAAISATWTGTGPAGDASGMDLTSGSSGYSCPECGQGTGQVNRNEGIPRNGIRQGNVRRPGVNGTVMPNSA